MSPDSEKPAKKAAANLARAAESSDAAVHKLLADRQALLANPEINPGAAEKVAAIDAELAEMGYSAS